jgi:hypothetical protein
MSTKNWKKIQRSETSIPCCSYAESESAQRPEINEEVEEVDEEEEEEDV